MRETGEDPIFVRTSHQDVVYGGAGQDMVEADARGDVLRGVELRQAVVRGNDGQLVWL